MLNKDEIKAKPGRLKVSIKENLGWLTDDHKAEDEGKDERIEGEAQERDASASREAEEARTELEGHETGS
jgi:uncharacterized protein YjbJ (UPF0337 family)